MDREHVISDEALAEIQSALLKNEQWMAYNDIPYFLGKEDIYFFKNQEEAAMNSQPTISVNMICITSFISNLWQMCSKRYPMAAR
jgi:hypothetical protein